MTRRRSIIKSRKFPVERISHTIKKKDLQRIGDVLDDLYFTLSMESYLPGTEFDLQPVKLVISISLFIKSYSDIKIKLHKIDMNKSIIIPRLFNRYKDIIVLLHNHIDEVKLFISRVKVKKVVNYFNNYLGKLIFFYVRLKSCQVPPPRSTYRRTLETIQEDEEVEDFIIANLVRQSSYDTDPDEIFDSYIKYTNRKNPKVSKIITLNKTFYVEDE